MRGSPQVFVEELDSPYVTPETASTYSNKESIPSEPWASTRTVLLLGSRAILATQELVSHYRRGQVGKMNGHPLADFND